MADSNSSSMMLLTATASLLYLAAASRSILKPKRKRKVWVKEWLRKREEAGAYNSIMNELKLTDQFSYRRYIRMDVHVFEVIEL